MTDKKGAIEEIADDLRSQIKNGDFGKQGRLPPIAQVAKKHGNSRPTVYEAFHLLLLEGLVVVRGNAYYANYPMLRLPGITPTFDQFLLEQGLDPKMENMILPELIEMPEEIAAIFHQSVGIRVIHRLRKQGTTTNPYRLAEIWYPAPLAEQFLEQMRQNPSLDVLSEIKRVHGVFIKRVEEEILTRIPTQEEAKNLQILRTAPVFEIRRANYTAGGAPVMFNRIILVGNYFSLAYRYETSHWD